MKVIFNPEAKAQVRRRRAWWKKRVEVISVWGQEMAYQPEFVDED